MFWYNGRPAPEVSYKEIEVELYPSAELDFSEALHTLVDGESIAIYYPHSESDRSPATLRPLPAGWTAMQVRAGTPVLPLVIRNSRPVRFGDAVTLSAGSTTIARAISPRTDQTDIVSWYVIPKDADHQLIDGMKRVPPQVELISIDGQHVQPLFMPKAGAPNLALLIFRSKAKAGDIVLHGAFWQPQRISVVPESSQTILARAGLPLIPAGAVSNVLAVLDG
ncbi:MAG: hypothetical protein ABI837_21495, partial [Acidobacteriota bacterium]